MPHPTQLPFVQRSLFQSPTEQCDLRARGSVHEVRTQVGDPAWLVTDHGLVRRLLADDRLGRSHPEPSTAARSGESALFGGPLGNYLSERTDHERMRSLIQPHFTPKQMRAFSPRVEALVDQLLDEVASSAPEADVVSMLATPLPILVICELLGVPYEDRMMFRGWTQAAADTQDRKRSEQGVADLFGYGQDLVAVKRHHPSDDVISRWCTTEGLDDDEIAMLSMALLFAGHETTVVQLGMGVLLLLAHPDQWQILTEEPSSLENAIDEILRAPGKPSGGIPRYARTDLEIGGIAVAQGDLVLLDTGSANHDGNVFEDPERFDIGRPTASAHLSFGHGPRYCIGAPLARLELRTALSGLVRRFPAMRLAVPTEDLEVHRGSLTGGLVELPVTW